MSESARVESPVETTKYKRGHSPNGLAQLTSHVPPKRLKIPVFPQDAKELTVAQVEEWAKSLTAHAFTVLARVMMNPKSPPSCRIAAATGILDRAFGRVPPAPPADTVPTMPTQINVHFAGSRPPVEAVASSVLSAATPAQLTAAADVAHPPEMDATQPTILMQPGG